ncbi:hypothetical protein CJ030_MR5G009664 [Morella rubra]|uniref:Uncharacterized protein n=1 Tax=Morella rubra TaxID=262757 RepID=A0A6A1VK58_9ROSI|nr:hypothetical protein CJ030_MR5G009664 [Morella rubra]
MANVGGSSSGAAKVPKAPERREGRWGPSQLVEIDFEAFYTEYHFPRETYFRLPSANETPYTDGVKGEMCFFEAPLKSGLIDFGIFVLAIKGFPDYFLPDTNKGWHDCYFFMSGVGWERFPGKDRQSESSLCWAFGSVPDQYRRDIKGLTLSEQAHVDAILEVGSIDWNALVCRENEGWLGYTVSEPSPRANPSPRSERSPRGRFPREDSRKESSHVSVGGTKQKNSQEVEGSFHGHSLKKRRASPPLGVSEAEEEEAEEAPLARMSSKRAASIGLEDVSPMLSPTSGVRMEIPVPAVKFLRSVGCMDSSNEERKVPIGPICRTTLSSFEAQFRRQQQALVPIQQQEVEEPPRHSHDQERPTWADAWMVDLKGMVASASVVRRLGDPCFLYRDSDDGIATIPQYHSRHLMCDVEDVGRH